MMPSDDELLARAAAWPTHGTAEDLTQPILAQIAEREGIDFATALLYQRLSGRTSTDDANVTDRLPRDVLVGVVPGAFYKEYAFTGADGQRVLDIARQNGLRAERIPLDSFGSRADNARTLRDWLRQHAHEEVYLVSLSKGGTDIEFALRAADAELAFRNVSLWLNLSGILQGTALADWLLAQTIRCWFVRLFAWWRGYRFDVMHELRRNVSEQPMVWPSHLRVVHVVGFPLRRHLQNPWAQRAHSRLEPWGPNDGGGILLADAVRWPGTLIPVWGADHYLRQEQFDIAGLIKKLLVQAVQPPAMMRG